MSNLAQNSTFFVPNDEGAQYSALEDMGITRVHEIESYKLRPAGADKDVLKIRYKRASGSLLPDSRTYKFGRSLKSVLADGGTARMEHTYEISPFLLKAVAELDTLVAENKNVGGKTKSRIGKERVTELLGDFEELENLLRNEVTQGDAAAASAKLARLKAKVAAL